MKNVLMHLAGIIYGLSVTYPKLILCSTIILQYCNIIDIEFAIILYILAIMGLYEISVYLKMSEVADEKATNTCEEIDVFNKYFKYTIANAMSKIFKNEEIKILCRTSFLNNRKEEE